MAFESNSSLPNIDALAASDFKDLIDSIEILNATTTRFMKTQEHLQEQTSTAATFCKEQSEKTKQQLEIIKYLEQEYQDIDAHYGWVLAGDHALVARVVNPRAGAEERPEIWMRNLLERHVKTKGMLFELKQGLSVFAQELKAAHA